MRPAVPGATIEPAVGDVVTIVIVVAVCLAVLGLRLVAVLRRRGQGQAGEAPDVVERWATHIIRGDRRD
jgi:hypothetical protein